LPRPPTWSSISVQKIELWHCEILAFKRHKTDPLSAHQSDKLRRKVDYHDLS
jgi:hypothetical protein